MKFLRILLITVLSTQFLTAETPEETRKRAESAAYDIGIHIHDTLGVDAPEEEVCFYEESTLTLSELIDGEEITLLGDPLNENSDEYGRLLRYVYRNNVLINEVLLKIGSVKHLSFFPVTLNDQFALAEENAKESGLGLWGGCDN